MTDSAVDASVNIVVYWRPGCGFCRSLLGQLDQLEVAYQPINIWDDPTAAATVRRIANGNETVPTVTVGSVGMVNPSVQHVLAAAGISSRTR